MAKKKVAKSKKPTFEQSLAELESIVAKLEGGQLGLADSLEEYEQGVKHLKSCYNQLTAAERRIELVSKVDASGTPRQSPLKTSRVPLSTKKGPPETAAGVPPRQNEQKAVKWTMFLLCFRMDRLHRSPCT